MSITRKPDINILGLFECLKKAEKLKEWRERKNQHDASPNPTYPLLIQFGWQLPSDDN